MNRLYDIAPSVSYRCRGELIKFKRKAMGLSQKYVAEKIRMSQSGLSKIEAGINEMPTKILELSDILNLDPKVVMSIGSNKDIQGVSDSEFIKDINSKLPNWKNVLMEALKAA